MKDVIIVGAGAAGLMAAGFCVQNGLRPMVFDKNAQPGRKLRITGKGRCNVTNHCAPQEVIASAHGGKFLYSALKGFSPEDVMAFFESQGVPLKTERGRRVFPQSDRAADIAEALVRFASGARFVRETVTAVTIEGGRVTGVKTSRGEYSASQVLLACGGASYPATGSDGSGYRLAEQAGHTIVPIAPSLVPLVEAGDTCSRLMGLSLRNAGVKVTAANQKKPVYTDFGELLFTHFGLSGPTILSASAHMRKTSAKSTSVKSASAGSMEPGKYTVHIDLKPALDEARLDARLLRDLEGNKNRQFANSLDQLLPQKLIPVVVERSGIPGETRCNSITREQRRALLTVLKDFTVEIAGFRPIAEAIVTAGGVSLKEVDPKTMASKLVEALYFAGEILDVDAPTGGYNLQIAFSTGRLAAESMLGEHTL